MHSLLDIYSIGYKIIHSTFLISRIIVLYILNFYTKNRIAKLSKNNVGHRCANFWENPAHQGTHHNSQVKTTIIYIMCDITTDTNENMIFLNAYRTKKIEFFKSVRFINRQHDYSYIF